MMTGNIEAFIEVEPVGIVAGWVLPGIKGNTLASGFPCLLNNEIEQRAGTAFSPRFG